MPIWQTTRTTQISLDEELEGVRTGADPFATRWSKGPFSYALTRSILGHETGSPFRYIGRGEPTPNLDLTLV